MKENPSEMSEDDDRSPPLDLGCAAITESSYKTRNCSGSSSSAQGSSTSVVFHSPYADQVLENVLENVLNFLTCRRDRSAASLVCKSWYRVEALTRRELFIGNCYALSPTRATSRFPRIRSVTIKGKPRFADFDLMPPYWGAHFAPWVVAMAEAYPWLEKVSLKRMSVTDDDLMLLPEVFPGLKELTVICCEDFSTCGLAVVASKCRELRVLDLFECDVDICQEEDWLSCFPESQTHLESLSFDSVECPVNFSSLEKLVARSPSLKKLRLNRNVSIRELCHLMVRAPQLTHLGTGSFGAQEAALGEEEADCASAFVACKSLVCLSGFREVTAEYLPLIYPICPNLISLNFSYAHINAEQFKSVIRHCHRLQTLWVLDTICDDGLQAVAATCKNLLELRVFPSNPSEENDGPVSEVGLQAISEGCRKLQSILYFCHRMTNAAVIAMSKNCPDLLVFRLCVIARYRPDALTAEPMDEGFGAIVMNCKKLTRLAVSGLLTDRAFRYIGEYGKLIRTLSVAFAGDSDMSLKYILEGCCKLQKLEIRDSPFGDVGLLSGMHHYYNMRFLWMSSCRLSPQGCQEITRALPNLVVEVIHWPGHEEELDNEVELLYMYRSLDGPRDDAPEFVHILR